MVRQAIKSIQDGDNEGAVEMALGGGFLTASVTANFYHAEVSSGTFGIERIHLDGNLDFAFAVECEEASCTVAGYKCPVLGLAVNDEGRRRLGDDAPEDEESCQACMDACNVLVGPSRVGTVCVTMCGPDCGRGCFGRERTAACRLLDGGASAAAAHSACWGAAGSEAGGGAAVVAAELVLMLELVAGDLVLTEKGGVPSVDRVVVNQHREHTTRSAALLTLVHAAGSLTLTPGHVVWLDGGFAPARSATVGSVLSNGVTITAITAHSGGIINPIVAGGTILASDKAGGAPVLAATADEWTANVLLSAYPKFSPSFALAALFPATVQAYYDDALETLYHAAVPTLRTLKLAAPAPLVGLATISVDAALVAGLGAYALGLNGAATLTAAALAVTAARRAARK